MDRGRRAEPYSNATIWTREIARNLAGHLSRVSKAHSCVDTRSPKSTRLPQFHHSHAQKRCPTSPIKTRQPLIKNSRNPNLNGDQELEFRGLSVREETDGAGSSNHTPEVDSMQSCKGKQEFITGPNNGTPQFENHTTSSSLAANQEVSDRSVRIPAVKPPPRQHIRSGNGNSIDATYDAPLVLPQQKQRLAHDYYKRQEQQKIWQENQALIKRLQSTKGTLNFKQWEKDGKWTQEFVRNQEKRRTALQQELRRAQASPQAVLRSKPLKSLHPHHLISLGSRGNCDATVRLASAANHRRITKLRKKKTSPPSSAYAVESPSTELDFGTSGEQAAFIPDNEIVAVRFTFSRGRSRGADTNTRDLEQLEQPGSLEVDESDRDMMSLSGAFSPGAELECALNAVAVNDSASFEQPQQSQTSETGTADDVSVEANESYQSDADFHSNNSEETGGLLDDVCAVQDEVVVDFETNDGQIVTAEGGDSSTEDEKGIRTVPNETVVAADVQDENKEQSLEGVENTVHYAPESGFETTCRDLPIETDERKSTPLPEAEHVHSEEEEEEYGGDNFDAGHLSSVRAAEGQHNKLEASYASEFEEEPFYGFYNNVPDAVPADNHANVLNAIPTDNQDEGDEEEEYSHDDFERSSVSSVTSSGRQRKDQSLQDIADSLGQRTPERSQTSEEGVSKRSRQLDFGSYNGDVEGEQGDAEVQEVQANEDVAEENIQVEDAHRPRRGRRVTVFWSEEEEKLLRRGVEKFGIGNWKKILLDGKDVFSSRRTNIDLKDKWKNLCRSTTRKRRRTSCTSNPPENATENEEQQAVSVTRSKAPSDETSEISSPESATPRLHRRGAASAAKKKANAEHLPAEEDGDHRAEGEVADANGLFSGHVTLKLATDKTVPKLVEVSVDLDTYKDVYALKAILRSSLLSDAPPDEDIQVIGLKSRVVFKDQEHLARCIQINGVEFFFVFEENPDEFV